MPEHLRLPGTINWKNRSNWKGANAASNTTHIQESVEVRH